MSVIKKYWVLPSICTIFLAAMGCSDPSGASISVTCPTGEKGELPVDEPVALEAISDKDPGSEGDYRWETKNAGDGTFTPDKATFSEAASGKSWVAKTSFTSSATGEVELQLNRYGKNVDLVDKCTVKFVDPSDPRPHLTIEITGDGSVSSAPSGISCPSTCNAGFEPGTQVILTATASSGSKLDGVSGGCTQTATGAELKMGTQDVTCRFSFVSLGQTVTITSSTGGQPAKPLGLVTLSVQQSPTEYCIRWHMGAGSDKTPIKPGTNTNKIEVRALSEQTYHVEVLDQACSSVVGTASTTLTVIPSTLMVELYAYKQHVKVTDRPEVYARKLDGTSYVSVTEAYDIDELLWLLVKEGETTAIQTATSGNAFKVSFDSAGLYWVHFMLKDTSGKYGYASTLLQAQ